MDMFHPVLSTLRSSIVGLIWVVSGVPVVAQDASAWDGGPHAQARLIGGSLIEAYGALFIRAGVEIRLKPGWHTYWRDPGDSGVPPTFDFAGSENLKGVTVLWPAPERFPDGAGGQSIGYTRSVILPLHGIPKEVSRGSLLHLKLSYAVCEKLCVLADADLTLKLPAELGTNERALITAESRVPKRISAWRR